MNGKVYKIQVPITTNAVTTTALVYTEGRKSLFHIEITDELLRLFGDKKRIFALGQIEDQPGESRFKIKFEFHKDHRAFASIHGIDVLVGSKEVPVNDKFFHILEVVEDKNW